MNKEWKTIRALKNMIKQMDKGHFCGVNVKLKNTMASYTNIHHNNNIIHKQTPQHNQLSYKDVSL